MMIDHAHCRRSLHSSDDDSN